MRDLPAGTVTMLFTDIEGSTRLLHRVGDDRYTALLAEHRRLLRDAFDAYGGTEVDTQGDAFFVAFPSADDALRAAVRSQRALIGHPWSEGERIWVRMGVHTGEPTASGEGYAGLDVHRAARICGAAHGGQIVVSEVTHSLLTDELAADLEDLGQHRLKDLGRPERLFQVVAAGLPRTSAPLKTLDVPTTLVAPTTPLIGRAAERAAVADLLRGGARLVTLTGPGGTGKTRLALQAGSDVLDDFADGVFFVPLASVRQPELVMSTIASAVGLREDESTPIGPRLVDHLRNKHLLLVADNLEQIPDAANDVGALLRECSRVTFLTTSRVPLRITGEHEFPVPPLDLDEAVELFTARARAVKPDFDVEGDRHAVVAEICNRLDRLPLAIELAAARIKVLPPRALLARLDQRLPLLGDGRSDRPERHRTLRTTIDWSYELLDAGQQACFRAFAVFVAGCTLDGADAVVGDDALDVFDTVTVLVDHSLMRQAGDDDAEEPRFRMLETIREFALEQLEASGDADTVRRRQARWLLDLAQRARPELRGPDHLNWFQRLEDEHDNFRAALAWALDHDLDTALGIVAALGWFWWTHGHAVEGARWAEAALDRAGGEPSPARAAVLHELGILVDQQGQHDRARALLEEALDFARASGDRAGEAMELNSLGVVVRAQGDLPAARALFEQALAVRRELGDAALVSNALANLGIVALDLGDFGAARTYMEEALAVDRERGDGWGIAVGLENLGVLEARAGAHERAAPLLREAATRLLDLGDEETLTECFDGLAEVAHALGNLSRAARLRAVAARLRAELGAALIPADQSAVDEAVAALRESLGDSAFEEAWRAGEALSVDEATALALSD